MTMPTPTLTHRLGIRDNLDSVYAVLFLENLKETLITVTIKGDNKAAIGWVLHGCASMDGSSAEKRAIERISGTREEFHTLHRLEITYKMQNVRGDSNAEADKLSRLSAQFLHSTQSQAAQIQSKPQGLVITEPESSPL